jgi:hypothetical protein
MRLAFAVTPGVRFAARTARTLEEHWLAAAEEAADISASRNAGALELASALTKVARLAPVSAPAAVSTLIGASDLDARIRRLLDGAASRPAVRRAWSPAWVVAVLALFSQTPAVGSTLHALFELLVRTH